MTLLEVLGITLGWATVVFVIVAAWRRFHAEYRECYPAAQPKQVGPPKCACGICTGKVQTGGLILTPEQLASVQTAVLAVGVGAAPGLAMAFDYANPNGVGRVCVVVVPGPMFTQVVEPAIRQHIDAMRSS